LTPEEGEGRRLISARARRREGFHHEIDVDGHRIVVDEPESKGGSDIGPSPGALLASSLAGCTAITVEMYADRKGWDVEGLDVKAEYEGLPKKSGERPTFDVTVEVPEGLSAEQVERIDAIAAKCPVHRMLSASADVNVKTVVAGS
jgi:putative redox protein